MCALYPNAALDTNTATVAARRSMCGFRAYALDVGDPTQANLKPLAQQRDSESQAAIDSLSTSVANANQPGVDHHHHHAAAQRGRVLQQSYNCRYALFQLSDCASNYYTNTCPYGCTAGNGVGSTCSQYIFDLSSACGGWVSNVDVLTALYTDPMGSWFAGDWFFFDERTVAAAISLVTRVYEESGQGGEPECVH